MGHETSVDVDHVKWFAGYGPKTPIGQCGHTCPHHSLTTIAWGPSLLHYELVACDVRDGCAGRCRAWTSALPKSNGGIEDSHPWLQVDTAPRVYP